MQFSSGVFLMLFLPITMAVYEIGGVLHLGHKFKNIVLLIASLFFYAWGEPKFVFVLLMGIVVDFFFGIKIEKAEHRKKFLLVVSMIFNLGILFVFKYMPFVTKEISRVIPITPVNIALPIGISFYTFQMIIPGRETRL